MTEACSLSSRLVSFPGRQGGPDPAMMPVYSAFNRPSFESSRSTIPYTITTTHYPVL